MKKLRTSLGAKVAAVVLTALCLGAAIASGMGVAILYQEDLYRDNLTYYDTDWCKNRADFYSYQVVSWYEEGVTAQDMASWFSRDNTSYAFALSQAGDPDHILLSNYTPEQAGAQGELVIDDYLVRWQVQSPLTPRDYFASTYTAFSVLYPMRYSLPVFLVVSAVILLTALIFLFAAAGHRKGAEGITLNLMDKLPVDLYLAAAVMAAAFLVFIPLQLFGINGILEMAAFIVFLAGALLVSLAFLLSLATRIKVGKWWQNSILWRVCSWCGGVVGGIWRWCWGMARGLVQSLPLIWKAALIFAGVTLLNAFFCAVMFASHNAGFGFLLFFVFNLALFCAFCYLAMNLQRLGRAGRHLAAGDLDHKVDTRMMYFDFKEHGQNLNRIGEGMTAAVEQRMRSERLKTELITNVSHDIKTPLTSIINYVDLLGQEELAGSSAEYVAVLDRQAKRLKKLTEDLVEASKASTGNLNVSLEPTNVCEIVRQALGEYDRRLEAGKLDAVVSAPDHEVTVLADGRLLWRVMDNLLSNACKYSLAGTRVYIDIVQGDEVRISVKNISRDRLNIDAQELMERFVRGDSARTSEGSGLGLNIARSLTELMGGQFALSVDGDLFKATVSFPRA